MGVFSLSIAVLVAVWPHFYLLDQVRTRWAQAFGHDDAARGRRHRRGVEGPLPRLPGRLNRPEPTAQLERRNQQAADEFYELAGTWLREKTRDTKKFPILFNELVTYGFRRNLLGVKWPALALNVAVVLICAGLLWYRWPIDVTDGMTARIVVVLVVAAAHALYFLLLVNAESVKAAARTYARQLIISCETFLATVKPTGKPAKKPAA